jgi:hypothetical protein
VLEANPVVRESGSYRVSATAHGRSNRYELCREALALPVRSLSELVASVEQAA